MRQAFNSRPFIVLIVVTLMLMLPATAWLAGEPILKIAAFDSSSFPEVQVVVTASGEGGKYVAGLTEANFTLTENGQPLQVSKVTTAPDAKIPMAVALVMDTSGSMAGEPAEKARSAAVTFVQSLGPQDEAAVYAFGGKVCTTTQVIPFKTDKGAVINAVNLQLPKAEGDTPFYDAVYQAVQAVGQAQPTRKAVVALTDGEDTCSLVSPGSLIEAANRAGISIYTVALNSSSLKPDILERISRLTGGVYLSAAAPSDLEGLYKTLSDLFKQQYVLRYKSAALCDGKEQKVSLRLSWQDKTAQDEKTYSSLKGVSACRPSIQLGVAPDQVVSAAFTFTPTIETQGGGVAKVEYALDGGAWAPLMQAPYVVTTPPLLAAGQHTVSLRVHDRAQPDANVATADLPFRFEPTAAAPTQPGAAAKPAQQPLGLYLLLGLAALLLLVAVVLLRRRPAVVGPGEPDGMTMTPVTPGTPFGPVGPAVDAAVPQPAATAPFVIPGGGGLAGGVVAEAPAPDATRVLHRKPQYHAWLVGTSGTVVGKQLRLKEDGPSNIGREGTQDVVIDDPTVSRQQARIRLDGDEFYIIDMAATNPTKVNGNVVTRQLLQDGDRIQFGETTFVFKRTPRV